MSLISRGGSTCFSGGGVAPHHVMCTLVTCYLAAIHDEKELPPSPKESGIWKERCALHGVLHAGNARS